MLLGPALLASSTVSAQVAGEYIACQGPVSEERNIPNPLDFSGAGTYVGESGFFFNQPGTGWTITGTFTEFTKADETPPDLNDTLPIAQYVYSGVINLYAQKESNGNTVTREANFDFSITVRWPLTENGTWPGGFPADLTLKDGEQCINDSCNPWVPTTEGATICQKKDGTWVLSTWMEQKTGASTFLYGRYDLPLETTEVSFETGVDFEWTGEAGDSDWHKAGNWKDTVLNEAPPESPGNREGEEKATISSANVVIGNQVVHLDRLTATGSLEVNQELEIERGGSIENLTLNADLLANDEIRFLGNSKWNDGTLLSFVAQTPVSIPQGAELTLMSAANGGSDVLNLSLLMGVSGMVVHQKDLDLKLVSADREVETAHGELFVNESGQYVMEGGAIVADPDIEGLITVEGIFASTGSNGEIPSLIRGGVFDLLEGDLNVPTGTLFMENILNMDEGIITVDSGATVVLKPPFQENPEEPGVQVVFDSLIEGGGTVRAEGVRITIEEDMSLWTDLDPGTGGFELNDAMGFEGQGTLINEGRMVANQAQIDAKFVNEGTFVVNENPDTAPLRLVTDGVLENKALTRVLGSIELETANQAEKEVIINRGTFELVGESHLVDLSGFLSFKNEPEGRILKSDEGVAEIGVFLENEGLLNVAQGRLEFLDGANFGSEVSPIGSPASIIVSEGAQLDFKSSLLFGTSSYEFHKDYEFAGAGELVFEDVNFSLDSESTLTNRGLDVIFGNFKTGDVFGGHYVNESGTTLFTSAGGNVVIELPKTMINKTDGTLEFDSGFGFGLKDAGGTITNEGLIKVQNGWFRVADLTGNFPFGNVHFINDGVLEISGGGPSEDYLSFFDLNFEVGRKGKVLLKDYAKVTLTLPGLDTFDVLESPDKSLDVVRGEWEIGIGSELVLENTELNLFSIGELAEVTIHGDPADESVPAGKFLNLTTPVDEFVNNGRLNLIGITIRAQGTYNNARLLFGNPARIEIPENSVFRNTGNAFGEIVVSGTVINDGFLSGGSSPGTIEVQGDFIQEANGEILIELGGTQAGIDYDQLLVSGTATLGGRLRIACLDDSFPDNGTIFTPITAGTVVGEFDEILFDVPSSRQRFDVVIDETGMSAETMILDVSTFAAWQTGVFTTEEQADENISGLAADPDQDGWANLIEYAFDSNPKVVSQPRLGAVFGYDQDGKPRSVSVFYTWAKGMTDVSAGMEYSTDLSVWTPLETTAGESDDHGIVTIEALEAELPSGLGERVFVRFVVSELP